MKFLSGGPHCIFNEPVNVWAKICDRERALLLRYNNDDFARPSGDDTPILLLNDDCLTEIFNYLPYADMSAIFDTCSRFRTIAPLAFKSNHKTIELAPLYDEAKHSFNFRRMKGVFRKFGDLITDLSINGHEEKDDSKKILDIITQYRSGALKSLHLEDCHIRKSVTSRLQDLFSNLESLSMLSCELHEPSCAEMFCNCNKLVKMHLRNVSNFDAKALENVFPMLKEFTLEVAIGDVTALAKFFRTHNKLEKIVFGCRETNKNATEMLQSIIYISQTKGNLKSLELYGFQIDELLLRPMQFLSLTLNSLKIFCYQECEKPYFSDNNQLVECNTETIYCTHTELKYFPKLEVLEFYDISGKITLKAMKEFIDNHEQIKEIKIINFERFRTPVILEYVVAKLKRLEKLTIDMADHIKWLNHLTKLETVKSLILCCVKNIEEDNDANEVIDPVPLAQYLSNFVNELKSKETLKYLQLTCLDVTHPLIDAIATFNHLRHFQLVSSFESSSHLPGGPNAMIIDLVTKLSVPIFLTIKLVDLVLEDRTYDAIMEIAHSRKQKVTIIPAFKYDFLENEPVKLDMELDSSILLQ